MRYSVLILLTFFTLINAQAVSAASARKLVKDANQLFLSKDSAKRADALNKYIEARDKRKDRFEVPFNIGTTYGSLNHQQEAQSWLEEAARSSDPKMKGDAHYQLGNIQFRNKKYDEAIKQYTEALRCRPADKDARKNLELSLFMKRIQPPDSSQQNQDDQKNQEQKQDSTQQQQPQKDEMLEKARERESQTQHKLMQRRNQNQPDPPRSGKDW